MQLRLDLMEEKFSLALSKIIILVLEIMKFQDL